MSQENVETMRHSFECWLSGDLEGWRETMDPEVGWDISAHPLPDVPNHGQGRDALLNDMLGVYMSGWVDYSGELTEMIDAGDEVVITIHETATMRETGVPLERDLFHTWTVREGRATFLRVFKTKAEAIEASDMPKGDPKTGEMRVEQHERATAEREAAEEAELPDETEQHRRRADKAAYLAEKLAERERSEREG